MLLHFHGEEKNGFGRRVMPDAFPLKGSFDGDGDEREDKTEAGLEMRMWVYVAVGEVEGGGWVKINKSDSLYLSA